MARTRTAKKEENLQKFKMKSGSYSRVETDQNGKQVVVTYKAEDVFDADPASIPKSFMDIVIPYAPQEEEPLKMEEVSEDEGD